MSDCHCTTCQLDQAITLADLTYTNISQLRTEMRTTLMAIQEQLDTLTAAVATGVTELRTEIARLAALPPEQVDFTALQSIADALAGDNIPSAPVEPPAV